MTVRLGDFAFAHNPVRNEFVDRRVEPACAETGGFPDRSRGFAVRKARQDIDDRLLILIDPDGVTAFAAETRDGLGRFIACGVGIG